MRKTFSIVLLIAMALLGAIAYYYYHKIFSPNIKVASGTTYILIPTASDFNKVATQLDSSGFLQSKSSFMWVAEKMNYVGNVKPGKYKIEDGMSNRSLVQILRSGKQTPVKLTFNNIRTKQDLALRIAEQLEVDSTELYAMLTDSVSITKLGFNTDNILSMFIPNTYEVYWNTSAQNFFNRMNKEYEKFWTVEKRKKANAIGLTPLKVSALASIVESETKQNSEKPVVAGVYMNRIIKGWKLEADPTLIFAMNDFTIKRVLNEYKTVESPYNTYKYAGLPPGPICLPEISSFEAVLGYTKHDYMYFCAREDLSGFHAFAKDYTTHLANARRYQAELNRRNIKQ